MSEEMSDLIWFVVHLTVIVFVIWPAVFIYFFDKAHKPKEPKFKPLLVPYIKGIDKDKDVSEVLKYDAAGNKI